MLATYEIIPFDDRSIHILLQGHIKSNDTIINISTLKAGLYVLNYYDTRNVKHSVKFKKQ